MATTLTWPQVINHLEGKGYKGDGSLAAVKTWLREKGHSPEQITTGDVQYVLDDIWTESADEPLTIPARTTKAIERKVPGHPHAASVQALGHRMDDADVSHSWHIIKSVKPEDFDQLDNAKFGEGDEFKGTRRAGGLENAAWVDYIRCVKLAGGGHSKSQERLERFNTKAQGEQMDSEGGYLTPALHRESIMSSVLDAAPWLGRITRISIDRRSIEMPMINDRDRSSQEIGGLALTPYAEAATIADDTLAFALATMQLTKAAKLVKISNELLADSVPNAGIEIRNVLANCVRYRMQEDVIRGTGVGQPLGVLNSPGTYTITRSGANVIDYLSDFGDMLARMEPGLLSQAVWCTHVSTLPQLMAFQITRGTEGISLANVWSPSLGAAPPGTLWGLPFFTTEACSQLGTTGDIILWHPASYYFVEAAGGPVIDASPHVNFANDQETLRVRHRRNGQMWRGQTLLDSRNWEVAQSVILST